MSNGQSLEERHPFLIWLGVIAVVIFFMSNTILWLIGILILYLAIPAALVVLAIWLINKPKH